MVLRCRGDIRSVSAREIRIHPDAPAQPDHGAACNGCGVCCLAEPCPIGMLVSRRRRGACAAFQWDGPARRYRCGLVSAPHAVLGVGTGMPARLLARLVSRLARRWISAGSGCDAEALRVR